MAGIRTAGGDGAFCRFLQSGRADTVDVAVAMLHSFWYEEAEKAFEQVTTIDPQCAMDTGAWP